MDYQSQRSTSSSAFRTGRLVGFILIVGTFCSSFHVSHISPQMAEICNNAIDDDGDGLIDLQDSDCDCPVIEPISLIPNPSFEESSCCPSSRSQLECAETWIQASEPTTDYIHTCGWAGWEQYPPPTPFPDGDAIVGFRDGRVFQEENEPSWKEYVGACLLQPLKKGVRYRFEFYLGFSIAPHSRSLNITFFGTEDCKYLPFGVGNSTLGCPTNGDNWYRLGSKTVTPFRQPGWVKTFIDVTPAVDMAAIAIGPSCPDVITSSSLYYFFDNLLLDDLRSFQFKIEEVNHPCGVDFRLGIPIEESLDYQWYKEGIALVGETRPQLSQMYGEGVYQVRTESEVSCNLTKAFVYEKPTFETTDHMNICEGDVYTFGEQEITESGEYTEVLTSKDGCDSTVHLMVDLMPRQADDAFVKIFEGETYRIDRYEFRDEGIHSARLRSSIGCDSIVDVHLAYYHVYFPNVFSPNGDGKNDFVKVYGNDDLVEILSFSIYDRWGGAIYTEQNLVSENSDGWNGLSRNKSINNGIYTYVVRILMDDGKERTFTKPLLIVN